MITRFIPPTNSHLLIRCRRRRIDGSNVRVTSRGDRSVASRKRARGEKSVLSNLTSSCCQGRRRRDAEARRRLRQRAGRQLMSVWDSGTDCGHLRHHQDKLSTSMRAINPAVIVDDHCDLCCHHHHHHHHLSPPSPAPPAFP